MDSLEGILNNVYDKLTATSFTKPVLDDEALNPMAAAILRTFITDERICCVRLWRLKLPAELLP